MLWDLSCCVCLQTPFVDSVDQKVEGFFCCKCSDEGSMTVKININKLAFVPGEPLVYEINIDNRSQNTIKEMDFILRQVRIKYL
jgi:hypothetical protein